MADRHLEGLPGISRAVSLDRMAPELAPEAAQPLSRAAETASAIARMAVRRTSPAGSERAVRSLLQLQRQYGNRYVEQVVARARQGAESNEIHPSVESAIHEQRGGGQHLDSGVKRQMETAMGANFSGVRIHTNARADTLNHALSARAFTTGQDIFFRQGAYQPGSFVGRELLAHELTHVVQQNGAQVSRKMSVSQPGDAHEVEAEQTAHHVMQRELHQNASRSATIARDAGQEEGMAMTCPSKDDAHRQPESSHEEDKKKHHAARQAEGSELAKADDEQAM